MARLNHLAIVVEDIQAALAFWHDALGLPLGSTERNEREEVDIAFLPLDVGQIELVSTSCIPQIMHIFGLSAIHVSFTYT